MWKTAKVRVKNSSLHGRGVFAVEALRRGSIVETCPVIVLPIDDVVENSTLSFYVYDWGAGSVALALGCGSLYNHADEPHAYAEIEHSKQTITIKVLRNIEPGEEVTLNYGDDYPREWS